jgi:formyltetrahydrofolate deformylase
VTKQRARAGRPGAAEPGESALPPDTPEERDIATPVAPSPGAAAALKRRPDVGRLLITCPERPGIISAVSGFLDRRGANVLSAHQYTTDPERGRFFLRLEFHQRGLDAAREEFEAEFARAVASPFDMTWRVWYARDRKRLAILVSRYEHCLLDLLWRWRMGELDADIRLVASNHGDAAPQVEPFAVPYVHIPVTPDTKPQAEERVLGHLAGRFDLVVLARYMQILSEDFLARVGAPVINIHHSFLPAFAGADPYRRAFERGVKVIGATAHYVTAELDAGPIIEQDVARVTHDDTAEALTRIGRDIERTVLARAVRWHLEDRVLVHENRTVVFR